MPWRSGAPFVSGTAGYNSLGRILTTGVVETPANCDEFDALSLEWTNNLGVVPDSTTPTPFSVVSGALVCADSSVGGGLTATGYALHGTPFLTPQYIEVEIANMAQGPSTAPNIFFPTVEVYTRASILPGDGRCNLFHCTFDITGAGASVIPVVLWELEQYDSGGFRVEQIASDTLVRDWTTRSSNKVRLESLVDGTQRAFIDGDLMASAHNANPPGDHVGFSLNWFQGSPPGTSPRILQACFGDL